MRFRSHKIALSACLIAVTALLVACGGGDDSGGSTSTGASSGGKEQVTVGVVYPTLAQEFWTAEQQGVQQGAREDGAVDLVEDSVKDYTEVQPQIAKVETMITKGVDAIVIQPVSADPLKPVLQRAIDAGIPVILLNYPPIDGLPDAHSTAGNQAKGGLLAGGYLARTLKAGEPVGYLVCAGQLEPIQDRIRGFKQGIGDTLTVAGTATGRDCTQEDGVSAMEDLLTAHPEIRAVWGTSDQLLLGALKAIRAAGKTPGRDILVVGFDAVSEAVAAIEAGTMAADISQLPIENGATAAKLAAAAARGEDVPAFTDTGMELVTKDNASQF